MVSVTIRNLPDEVHRAIKVRAAANGRSTEAEIREILTNAVKPAERVRIGDALSEIGRQLWDGDEQPKALNRLHTPPLSFDE